MHYNWSSNAHGFLYFLNKSACSFSGACANFDLHSVKIAVRRAAGKMDNSTSSGKKRSYTTAFKMQVVEHAEKHSKNGASRVFSVHRKCVQQWCKAKEDLQAAGRFTRRLPGGGRKPLSTCIETQLVTWLQGKRSLRLRVTRKMVCQEAIKLHRQQGNTVFVASRGWLTRFMERQKISLRRRTTVSQRLPRDLAPKVVHYLLQIRKMRKAVQYELKDIGAMDETALWLDMPAPTTLDFVGERSIPIKTTGHEKVSLVSVT